MSRKPWDFPGTQGKGGLATGDTEPMWVKITFREDVDTNHSVPMAQRSENYYALFFKSAMGGQEIAVGFLERNPKWVFEKAFCASEGQI